MSDPTVTLPALRAFIGQVALKKTTSTTATRALYKLQGALAQSDVDVSDVINAAIDAIEAGTFAALTAETSFYEAVTPESIALALTAITLSAAQAKKRAIVFTQGAATAGDFALALWPLTTSGFVHVRNSSATAGAVLRHVGGEGLGTGDSVYVPPGASRRVLNDGTNFYPADGLPGEPVIDGVATVTFASANIEADARHTGSRLIVCAGTTGGAARELDLNALPDGSPVCVWNDCANSIMVGTTDNPGTTEVVASGRLWVIKYADLIVTAHA